MKLGFGATLLVAILPALVRADDLSAFSEFQRLTPQELRTFQGKLEYVGVRTKMPGPPVLFTATTQAPDLSVFEPFHRPEDVPGRLPIIYSSAYDRMQPFTISAKETRALIKAIAKHPGVTDGDVDSDADVSFALSVVKNGKVRVFESIVDTDNGTALMAALLEALKHNRPGCEVVKDFACSHLMAPGPKPSNVTSQVSIAIGAFESDSATYRHVTRIRITNTSGSAIAGPMIYAFLSSMGSEVVRPDGRICRSESRGWPFVVLPVGSKLGAGQHVEVTLRFETDEFDPVEIQYQRVYSGPGIR